MALPFMVTDQLKLHRFDQMNKEIKALRQNSSEAEEQELLLNHRVEDLEKINAELLDISSALLKLVNRNTTRNIEESIKN